MFNQYILNSSIPESSVSRIIRFTFSAFCIVGLLAVVAAQPALSQNDGLLEIDGPMQRFLNRQQTAGKLSNAILSQRPLSVYEARNYLREINSLDGVDSQLLEQYLGRSAYSGAARASSWWSTAFSNGRDLFSKTDSTWSAQINPILNLSAGRAFFNDGLGGRENKNVWRFSRGVRFSGHIGKHVYFEGQFTENQEQVVDPNVAFQTAPGRPNTKLTDGGAYDWLDNRAIVGYYSKHFDIRMGRDSNLWGNGAKSTVLSNAVATYDQVQIRTSLGRFRYTTLFSSLASFGPETASGFLPKKYTASHALAVRLGDRTEISVFETLVFATDSLDTRSRFDFVYASPIIFLRAAERDRGSPDNAMVGVSASYRLVDGFKLYGEFLLDEYVPEHRGEGWWANKWAWQLGTHLVNIGLPRTDFRIEFARMRPFLYSHGETINSYTHFGDVMGHPSGPNAWNLIFESSWIASRRITLTAVVDITYQGVNTDENLGSDPNVSYDSRAHEFGNDFLQGNLVKTSAAAGLISFEALPDLFFDFSAAFVSTVPETGSTESYLLPRLVVRWGSAATHFSR